MVARHFGMDWLRIGAFALLIFYHVGMVFVPWGFHIKAEPTLDWATIPMLALNAWRLTLLFVVSGYASRALLSRSAGRGAFLKDRSWRLLVPLAFGMAVIVPPQPWVELVVRYGYPAGYLQFWANDYLLFHKLGPLDLPTWNHLWFVAYLWVYTAALVLGVAVLRRAPVQGWFDRVFGGVGVLGWPLLWLGCVHGWWFAMARESHALFGDWVAHASYLPALLFGFGLARSPAAMAAIVRWRHWALATALIGYAAIVAVELNWPGNTPAPRWMHRPYGVAHALQQWGAIVALIAYAERHWNRDAPIRTTLVEAVFPFYVIHQTIIVVAMFWLLDTGLPPGVEFVVLVAATAAGCFAFYRVGRAIGWLRPLIGLRRVSGAQRVP